MKQYIIIRGVKTYENYTETPTESKPFNRSPRNFTDDYVGDPYFQLYFD